MNIEDINVEAGLRRDHELRGRLAVCRYGLAAIVFVVGATAWSCSLDNPLETAESSNSVDDCGPHAPCAKWRAEAQECQRWTQ